MAPLAALWLLASAGTPPGTASGTNPVDPSDASDTEYKVKAASLFHFIRYTTWPERCFKNERSPIVVMVVGGNPFGRHLEAALEGKVVGLRPIHLRYSAEVPDEITAHLVFEGQLGGVDRRRLLAITRGLPCLLFGDRLGYARSGACGNFFVENGRVGFEINVDAVKWAGLEMSSQLLKLARIVRTEGEGE